MNKNVPKYSLDFFSQIAPWLQAETTELTELMPDVAAEWTVMRSLTDAHSEMHLNNDVVA